MSNYNLEQVFEMAGEDKDFVKVVVQTFLEEIPPDIRAMNEAVEAGNAGLAYQFAHKMKPNFQMFGLELMPQIETIEAWAKTGDSNEVGVAIKKINTKVSKALNELTTDFDLE